ncbi:hypothetical protein [uncultured Psychroserpens sp.]|uniref:hypothetical protein n=1 Tax=uncultured Psychroserpens sp. TaxID=255436 RepID=UPI002610B75B|nr:hypothetical protein [uncultured Psychroserpens sp.]
MYDQEFGDLLKTSLNRQREIFENSLILNPVENVPQKHFLEPATSFIHGLYNSDKLRSASQKKNTVVQFSGRDKIAYDINLIYKKWANHLGAEDLSMRLLSGLHSHIIVFMGLGKPKDRVMLLPPEAGGHFATKGILERLGYLVDDIPVDYEGKCIDIKKAKKKIKLLKPQFLFIDRSEGLNYEDFSELVKASNTYAIFDASQYLSNILAKDFKSPFDMGFNLVISTIHKNFPGPQRAITFTKKVDENWIILKTAMSKYVSNMHTFSIYSAGLAISNHIEIQNYSKKMLDCTILLDKLLLVKGVPIVKRKTNIASTHHSWILCKNKETAFNFFSSLERTGIYVNYRLLPYKLGYGIRIGTAAAISTGITIKEIPMLANWISIVYHEGFKLEIKHKFRKWLKNIRNKNKPINNEK